MKIKPTSGNAKKGFTLAELCVVMAIVALIGTMVVTTIVFMSRQNVDIKREASFISEVTTAQKQINDWIKRYDNAQYRIVADGSQKTLEAVKAEGGEHVSTITFSEADKKITVEAAAISDKYVNVSAVSFKVVEDRAQDGTVEGKIAEVTVRAKKGSDTESQTLLFPLFANETRVRSVTGKG